MVIIAAIIVLLFTPTQVFLPKHPYDFICRLFEHASVVWDNLILRFANPVV